MNGIETVLSSCHLLFDSGNTVLHCADWDGERTGERVDFLFPETARELKEKLLSLTGEKKPEKITVSSVSPKWREPLIEILESIAPGALTFVRSAEDIPMEVAYPHPETLGVDRILAAYAAYKVFGTACVVIDAGTAVTVDAVDKDGVFKGGFIFPGAELLTWSLAERTGLPLVAYSETPSEIGASTEECIARAVFAGFNAAVQELLDIAGRSVGGVANIALTGGNADNILGTLTGNPVLMPNLVLTGLGLLADTFPRYEKS